MLSFIQEQRKEQIINACIEELAGSGYENMTFKSIAKRADINPSLVSYHFKSKNILLFTLLEHIFMHKIEYIQQSISEDKPVIERIEEYINASLNFQRKFRAQNIAMIEIVFNARTEDNKAFYLMDDDEQDGVYLILNSFIEEGIETKQFKSNVDVKILTRIINGAIDEMIFAPENDSESERYGEELFKMVKQYLCTGGGHNE
ncbi:MAG TPA: TetR/AcrR family transcriptional regulator [Candidatus Salinicoccus merdavium]|nr:TetR/AcrR family transcriptional regulator [Candidatus Salinicoccus merdavium]